MYICMLTWILRRHARAISVLRRETESTGFPSNELSAAQYWHALTYPSCNAPSCRRTYSRLLFPNLIRSCRSQCSGAQSSASHS